MSESLFPTGKPSRLDVLTFAEGIVERFDEAKPNEITDEARLLYELARTYVEGFNEAMEDRRRDA